MVRETTPQSSTQTEITVSRAARGKVLLSLSALAVIFLVLAASALMLGGPGPGGNKVLVQQTPTVQTLVLAPSTATVGSTATLTSMPTDTAEPSSTPDLRPNPAASETIPVPTAPPPPTATAVPPTATAAPAAAAPPATATDAPKARVAAAKPSPTKDPSILPNGVRYGDHTPKLPNRIVRIQSPNIKLDTKVYEVYAVKGQWEVAEYAAGHNFNSMNPGEGGNIVLAGHNNWRGEVFRYLEFLKPGDTINVWTLEGKQYTYKVQEIRKLKEAGAPMAQRIENGKVMNPTASEQLTLITCWPYTTFTHRLIVIATPLK